MEAAFENIWHNIEEHEGESFITCDEEEFSYQVLGCCIDINNGEVKIPRKDFYMIYLLETMEDVDDLDKIEMPRYTRKIMTDRRIISGE